MKRGQQQQNTLSRKSSNVQKVELDLDDEEEAQDSGSEEVMKGFESQPGLFTQNYGSSQEREYEKNQATAFEGSPKEQSVNMNV